MDLGFSKNLQRDAVPARVDQALPGMELAVLLAVSSARQAASPTASCLRTAARGGVQGVDQTHLLAWAIMRDSADSVDVSRLGGSFCPSVAGRLTVGQEA